MNPIAQSSGNMRQKTILLLLLFLGLPWWVKAQDEEYKMDLGGGAGACFYLGDANSTPYRNMSGMIAFVARYVYNPRMALKANLAMGHISGKTDGLFFPMDPTSETAEGGQPGSASFKRNVFDLGAQFEFNFWGYGTGVGYRGDKRFTPYMTAGLGLTFAPKPVDAVFAFNFPVGVGVKYKIKERLNIGLEWSIRFTTSDALDVSNADGVRLKDPYGISSSGFKNKDCYSFTMMFLTYDMFPRCKTCNKDD